MAREILQGPSDEGRASYQLAITTCDHCGQGFQQGVGELLPVEPEIVEMAETHKRSGRCRASVWALAPAKRSHRRFDAECCDVTVGVAWCPWCRHGTFVDIHHLNPRSPSKAHRPEAWCSVTQC